MTAETTWIVVADSSRCTIYDSTDDGLRTIHEMDHPDARAHTSALMTGGRGRTQAPQNRAPSSGTPASHGSAGARSAMEPTTPRKEVEATHFMIALRDWLHTAATRNAFDGLVLVASPSSLGILRDRLTTPVQNAVRASLAKDYTTLSEQELHKHLHSNFPDLVSDPSRRARIPPLARKGNQQPTA